MTEMVEGNRRGGARPGAGRPRGRMNDATIEIIAAGGANITVPPKPEPTAPASKRAKDRLAELLNFALASMAYYQPSALSGQENAHQNWQEFHKWQVTAANIARILAPYQDPTFRAILVTTPGEMIGTGFAAAGGSKDGPADESEMIDVSQGAAQAAYLRMVKGGE